MIRFRKGGLVPRGEAAATAGGAAQASLESTVQAAAPTVAAKSSAKSEWTPVRGNSQSNRAPKVAPTFEVRIVDRVH